MAIQTTFTVSTGVRMKSGPKTGGIKMRRLLLCRFVCMVTLLAAASSIDASQARAAGENAQTGGERCAAALQDAGHPPGKSTAVLLRLVQPSIEPVPATDGLTHLAYVTQVTNHRRQPVDILGVVAVDPLAGFVPTGRNIALDKDGQDVAGKVMRFGTQLFTPPDPSDPVPDFVTRLPAESGGLMLFDVTYPGLDQIPRLLAHTITVDDPVLGPGVQAQTNPVPVGCVPLAVIRPPLVGHGWLALYGCCTFATYHRDSVNYINGDIVTSEHFAIDFIQLGSDNSALKPKAPHEALSSWWAYGTPVLAVAHGVVAEVVDGMPDQEPVGKISNVTAIEDFAGNHIIEDIGGGRYVGYFHLKPGTIPAGVRKGAVLRPGELIGRVGSSGNSSSPHLHFQLMNSPSAWDSHGLPFVFDTQLLEGRLLSEADAPKADDGKAVTIDRAGAGVKRNLMPARNDIFGYNLPR